MDFDSGIVDHRDEAALAKIFLPRFRNIDGKTFCDGKSLVSIVHWLAGWMRQSVLIHQIKMKFPVVARHPGLSPQCTLVDAYGPPATEPAMAMIRASRSILPLTKRSGVSRTLSVCGLSAACRF